MYSESIASWKKPICSEGICLSWKKRICLIGISALLKKRQVFVQNLRHAPGFFMCSFENFCLLDFSHFDRTDLAWKSSKISNQTQCVCNRPGFFICVRYCKDSSRIFDMCQILKSLFLYFLYVFDIELTPGFLICVRY